MSYKKGYEPNPEVDPQFFEGVDPDFIEKITPFLEGLYKHYFRVEVEGWEHVREEPTLYVGNHNGMITFEVLMLFYAWWQRYKGSRKAFGLAHGVAIHHPFFSWITPKIGAIPASQDYADEALRRDHSLLIFPGGEKEAMRPFIERAKVDFFQRKGFIKLALRNKVPIAPLVSIGAHESFIIFSRGEELAEALGLKKKYRLHGLPLTARSIFFAWCMASGLFTFFPLLLAPAAFASIFVPLPAKMKFRLLPPIYVHELVDPGKSEEENLQMLYDLVIGKIQDVLTEEYQKRKLPILG